MGYRQVEVVTATKVGIIVKMTILATAVSTAVIGGLFVSSMAVGLNSIAISEVGGFRMAAVNLSKEKTEKEQVDYDKLPRYVPGEIIVKFKDTTLTNDILKNNKLSAKTLATGDSNLDKLFSEYGIESAEKVLRTSISDQNKLIEQSRLVKFKSPKLKNNAILHQEERVKNLEQGKKIDDLDNLTQDFINKIKKNSKVEYAEPNYIFNVSNSSPCYSSETKQLEAHRSGVTGNHSVKIAIVDTGVDSTHEDLAANVIPGYDFVNIDFDYWSTVPGVSLNTGGGNCSPTTPQYCLDDYFSLDSDPADKNGHGTHVAGIAAALDNTFGITGVCPGCSILPVRAGFSIKFNNYIIGTLENDDIYNAIIYATDHGANVINMSFGGSFSDLQQEAIQYAYAKGVTLVAAAGNFRTDDKTNSYPAAFDDVLAVSALGDWFGAAPGEKSCYGADFSNYGSWVDVAAPGSWVKSTVPKSLESSGYAHKSGTSMASPYVAGQAGLILSKYPGLSPKKVANLIELTANPNKITYDRSHFFGSGVIDVYNSVTESIALASDSDIGISHPLDNIIVNSSIIIDGRVQGSRYKLEYSTNPYNNSWSSIVPWSTITNPNFSVTWDPSSVHLAVGKFYVKLTAEDISGGLNTSYLTLFNQGLGWPKFFYTTLGVEAHPTVTKLSTSSNKKILIISLSGNPLYGVPASVSQFDFFGNTVIAFPSVVGFNLYGNQLVVGDINNDGEDELVIAGNPSGWSPNTGGWVIEAHSKTGGLLWRRSDITGAAAAYITIEDLDNDKKTEILYNHYILNGSTGTNYKNFVPTKIPSSGLSDMSSYHLAIDTNGDSKKEIIYGDYSNSSSSLNALSVSDQGSSIVWSTTLSSQVITSIVSGDINNDGWPEIMVGTMDLDTSNLPSAFLYILDRNGHIVSRIELSGPGASNDGTRYTKVRLALADLDASGNLEIIATYFNQIFIISNGTISKVIANGKVGEDNNIEGLAIADVNNDNFPEIVVNYEVLLADNELSGISIWDRQGGLMDSRIYPYNDWGANPVISDLNGDGKLEIIVHSRTNSLNSKGLVDIWSLPLSYNPTKMDWPMLQRNFQHTGVYPLPSRVTFTQPTVATQTIPGVSMSVTWIGPDFPASQTGQLYLFDATANTMITSPYQDYIDRTPPTTVNSWNLLLSGGSFNPTLRNNLPMGSYKFVFADDPPISTIYGTSPVFTVGPYVTISQPTANSLVSAGKSMQVSWTDHGFAQNQTGYGLSSADTGFLYLYNATTNTMVVNPYQDYINRGYTNQNPLNGWNLYLYGVSFNPTLRNDLLAGYYKYVMTDLAGKIVGVSPRFYVSAYVPPTCTSNWSCAAWDQCSSSGTQTRTCIDANKCPTPTNQPAPSQSCTYVTLSGFSCLQGETTYKGEEATYNGSTCADINSQNYPSDAYGPCQYGSLGSCAWDYETETCINNCQNLEDYDSCINANENPEDPTWCIPASTPPPP